MEQCFIIQPFDRDTFDKRYKDTFELAIKNAGLTPYRVDNDPRVRIPIEDIEKNIRESKLCFAEITTNNPNVWYELGYAFACGKDVIMVCCSDERTAEFPFDIRHKHITTYKAKSASDFETLSNDITIKAKAYLSNLRVIDNFSSPVAPTEGLSSHEITALIIILENQPTEFDTIPIYRLSEYMSKVGYLEAATNIAIRTLKRKNLIEMQTEDDHNGYRYNVCRLTNLGEDWIINNQDKIRLTNTYEEPMSLNEVKDDLPF